MAGALPGSRRGGGRGAEEMGDAALGVGSRLAAPSQILGGGETGVLEEDQLPGTCVQGTVQAGDGAGSQP